jgi:hypothetical protein
LAAEQGWGILRYVGVDRLGMLMFIASLLAASAVHFAIRSRVNKHLPSSMRVPFWERDYVHLMKLDKQFYPDSPLRFWFWSLMVLALGAWILAFFGARTRH